MEPEVIFRSVEKPNVNLQGFEGECVLPNILELSNHFEETGINLGRDETFRIYLGFGQQVKLPTSASYNKLNFSS